MKPTGHAADVQSCVQTFVTAAQSFDWHSPFVVHAPPSAVSVGFGWPSSHGA